MKEGYKSGCLGLFLAPFLKRGKASEFNFPYGKRDAFLSPAEISFFHVVRSILPPEYHLCTKVRLLDLFFVRQPHRNQAPTGVAISSPGIGKGSALLVVRSLLVRVNRGALPIRLLPLNPLRSKTQPY